ncbi:MAG: SGNH/GDSL hydrolase family protein [Bacteroidota bacterium]
MKKTIIKILKWAIIIFFILFLVANIVITALGITSILLFSVIITITFLISEWILRTRSISRKSSINTRVLIASIFIGILIVESGLRIVDKYDSYNEQAGGFFYRSPYFINPAKKSWIYTRTANITKTENKREYKYIVTTNSEGLRDIEHPKQKIDDEYRIIGLGASFTEGAGVSYSDLSWVKVLGRNLDKKIKHKKITAINAGIADSDPFFELILLKEKLLDYDPDLVIVAINSSDITNVIVRGGMERVKPDKTILYRAGPWFEMLFGMSYISRFFFLDVLKYDWLFLKPDEKIIESRIALEKIYSCILMFEELSKNKNFDLLIVFHPRIHEVIKGKFDFDEMILNLNSETQIAILDLLDFFINRENMNKTNVSKYYWPINKHHNAKGYELFAKGVEEKILDWGFIDTLAL